MSRHHPPLKDRYQVKNLLQRRKSPFLRKPLQPLRLLSSSSLRRRQIWPSDLPAEPGLLPAV
jgi:hypothetical protein